MSRLDQVWATLRHTEPDEVPCFEEFSDDNAEAKFVPRFGNPGPVERRVAQAEFMGNCLVGVGGAGLRAEIVERGPGYYIREWENGARWRIVTRPHWWREYAHYPLARLRDLERVQWPDPDDPARYAGVAERVRTFTDLGYFTQAGINGFFSGIWYFWRPFETFMVELLEEPRLAGKLVDRVGAFNLSTARHLLECGVHAIAFPDDLGHNLATFISPRLYKEVFLPWHRRLAELCHDFGAYVNMHSHGNINALMPWLYEAGIDILNPVGPSDGMSLPELKRRYGDRMTFMGGVSKFIGRMGPSELYRHLRAVMSAGSPGGGFILYSEGNIPVDMPRAKVYLYLLLRRQLAAQFGARMAGRMS
jgi:uroporphyrinogen decarboxylase